MLLFETITHFEAAESCLRTFVGAGFCSEHGLLLPLRLARFDLQASSVMEHLQRLTYLSSTLAIVTVCIVTQVKLNVFLALAR